MARPNVPQFGDWDSKDNVPYTVYFEKARKNKGGKIINPNDPSENPEMFAKTPVKSDPNPTAAPPSRHRVQQEETVGRGAKKAATQPRASREENEFRQFAPDSPARYRTGGRVAAAAESPHHQSGGGGRGTGSGRPTRPSAGSEHSFERSPLHPAHQARVAGKSGNASPSWDGKRANETTHGTPGRSRMKPKSHDEAPGRDVIPEFGTWDVNDPQSADNYTYIFGQNAKGVATARDTNSATSSYNNSTNKQISDDEPKSCCFPWGKK